MPFLRFLPEGAVFPRGYGLAWRDWMRDGCVCAPVPFNRILRVIRDVWIWLRAKYQPSWFDKQMSLAIARHRAGWMDYADHHAEGEYMRGVQDAATEALRVLEAVGRDGPIDNRLADLVIACRYPSTLPIDE